MKPIVIDDFIPEIYQESIYQLMTGSEFNWTFHDYSVNDGSLEDLYQIDSPYQEHVQMRHVFVRENDILSPHFKYIAPLLGSYTKHTESSLNGMFRIKANLLVRQPGPRNQMPHADGMNEVDGQITGIGKKTLLYYVNESDGETVFYDKYFYGKPLGNLGNPVLSVTPKKGRAVLFDSNHLHAGTCPSDSKFRMVINCVFYE
jgi:hypothetical protein